MRMQVEKKSGLVWKGRRIPRGGEIEVGSEREAKLLEAVRLASRIPDHDAPRTVAAVLKAPSAQRGPLVERAPAEIALLAEPLRGLVAPQTSEAVLEKTAEVLEEPGDGGSNTREGGTPLEVLNAEPATADATAGVPAYDSPGGGPMGAGQASAEAPAAEPEKPRRGRKPKASAVDEPAAGAGEGVE